MEKNFDFVGLGYCSNDYLSILPEIPLDSKVQILHHMVQGGGPAATAAVAAARLGLKTAFVSVVGDDDPGKRILSDLELEKVDTSFMAVRKGETSPIAYCWVEEKTGKRSVAWTRGTIQELQAEEIPEELIARARLLHLDGHNPKGAIRAAELAKKHGCLVNIDAGTMRDGMPELIALSDIFIASEEFALRWTGEKDAESALRKMEKTGAKVTGLTRGVEGSMMIDHGTIITCPAFPIRAVDTTGAGDVFHSAFGVRYLETQDLMTCMRFASAVSALKCLKPGGRTGIPTRAEVDEFLRNNP